MSSPFHSKEAFRSAFSQGLNPLLELEQLGTFILVLANASIEKELHQRLSETLQANFESLYKRFEHQLLGGEHLKESEEDLLVFFKIATIGLNRLAQSVIREESGWEVQFNPLRALRPRRIASSQSKTLSLPFCRESFHFNKPFMDKEIFWSGELEGKGLDLYYNKYPFTQGHTLLVPERNRERPQLLDEADHHYLMHLAAKLESSLPGIGFGYNSYGAYASVNHLHFQLFLRDQSLPIESPMWLHNGGDQPYPAHCARTNSPAQAWKQIARLHQLQTPYNILSIGKSCYLLPRRHQGNDRPPVWSSGFTWYEVAGGLLTSSHEAYRTLSGEEISQLLAAASSG